jgi:hypothetical protein
MASHHLKHGETYKTFCHLHIFEYAYFVHVPKVLNVKSLMLKVAKVFFVVILIWEHVVVINCNVWLTSFHSCQWLLTILQHQQIFFLFSIFFARATFHRICMIIQEFLKLLITSIFDKQFFSQLDYWFNNWFGWLICQFTLKDLNHYCKIQCHQIIKSIETSIRTIWWLGLYCTSCQLMN